nr:TonB-dependent receptor [Ameyamaea chiangmaiensis]
MSAVFVSLTPVKQSFGSSVPLVVGKNSKQKQSIPFSSRKTRKSYAQNTSSGPSEPDEAIAVMGQRQAFLHAKEQSVPDAATHITAAELISRGIVSNVGLQSLASNVTTQSMLGTATVNYYIRGVGLQDYTQNNTSPVMMYMDDVAFPLSTMTSGMLFDTASVDIVPGPVGTAHGLADTGGEIHIHTADPTKVWHYGARQDIASYARSITDVYVSGPLARNVQFRLAGQTMHGGGWQYDPQNHTHLGDANEGALRGKLAWQPDNRTDIMLTGHWMRDLSQVVVGQPVLNLDPSLPTPVLGSRQANWDLSPQFAHLVGRSATMKPSENNMLWGVDIKASRDLGFATLKSISAYEAERESEYTDQDGTVYRGGDMYRNIQANVFSQELRMESEKQSPIEWVVGLYYNRVRMKQSFYYDFTDYRRFMVNTHYGQNQQAFSQFADLTYKLPHGVRLLGGINHESDDRQLLNLETVHINSERLSFYNEGGNYNQFSGHLGVQWQPIQQFQVYFKVSKGYKPGSFTANDTAVQAQLRPTKPESVLAFEVGEKADVVPNKIRLNAAAFYYSYHNQQILSDYLVPNYGPEGMFVNIPHSEIWGVEFSAEIHPLPHVYVHENLGYQRMKFTQFQALDLSATNALYKQSGAWSAVFSSYNGVDGGMPKLTLNGDAEYRQPVLSQKYQISPGIDWMYRDSQALQPGGLGPYRLPPYFLLGAHLTLKPMHGPWYISVYASNLVNRRYYVTGQETTTTFFWVQGPPRFVGGRLGINF